MEIKDLKIGDKVSVEVGSQQFKDTDDEKWVYETIFGTAEVTKVNETYEYANVIFGNGTYGEINADVEWYPIPSNTKIATHKEDVVNNPSHYTYGDIEVIDYCDQVCKTYPPELAPYVFNAIKYVSRATHKNGKEDIAKAKYYVQRLFDKWEA
ncbi:DUF3310 domain-containing protein [Staphylococcus pseudintermedius]|uniref:DUF3310 domain-containing protein n=1 Tax=Staphylococcus pseudintermedius TaxID=283734 RepID=UPI000DF22F3C|nr:DUF3310 domain-containing protein [Staphylococcus pseudintermedius]EKH2210487.1 DUF3310 domain-containing protein [Staphylococcus pseudintermedius]MDK3716793.1 DUF3310 domain-containing protein [Staphylococcus pseudintermedius]RCV95463.1 hypothetical protein BOW67_06115 [Staphylococcus pseudintermedius]